jgi:hypothetical protein
MRRWHKILASLWTTILVAPLILAMVAYSTATCGEYDHCPTGASYPYRPLAILLIVATVLLQLAVLAMIWKIRDEEAQPLASE